MAVKAHNQYIITFLKDDFMAEQCLKSKVGHPHPQVAIPSRGLGAVAVTIINIRIWLYELHVGHPLTCFTRR
jgi:hypothetical protein